MSKIEAVEVGESVRSEGVRYDVHQGDRCSKGHWLCVTHDEPFTNNLEKDHHINSGDHRLAWVCTEHGQIEAP